MSLRYWAWSSITAHVRARAAYERGLDTFNVTLEVLLPGYTSTLDNITSIGWRLVDKFEHPRIKTTKVTPRSDGTHRVVRTQSQKTTFYFVRDDPPATPPIEHAEPSPTWPPGWYKLDRDWQWWDGSQWVDANAVHPQPAQGHPHDAPGMSTSRHLLHFILTFFTCGLWAPVWIVLARRQRKARR